MLRNRLLYKIPLKQVLNFEEQEVERDLTIQRNILKNKNNVVRNF